MRICRLSVVKLKKPQTARKLSAQRVDWAAVAYARRPYLCADQAGNGVGVFFVGQMAEPR